MVSGNKYYLKYHFWEKISRQATTWSPCASPRVENQRSHPPTTAAGFSLFFFYFFFSLDPSSIIAFSCHSVINSVRALVEFCSNWICQICYMEFCKFWFVKIDQWISLICSMDLPKLIYGFSCYMDLPNYYMYYCFVDFSKFFLCNPSPLPNKIKLKCDQDFKACWSFCFELKVLNELKHSMHWVRCAFGKNFSLFFRLFFKQWSPPSTTVARSFSTASPLLNK